MSKLSENDNLAKRIKTLKEINFGFSLFSHNEVKLCNYDENSFQKSIDKNSSFVEATIEELCSVLTTFSAFYIVEIFYQRSNVNTLP
jgi:hypothetical protein